MVSRATVTSLIIPTVVVMLSLSFLSFVPIMGPLEQEGQECLEPPVLFLQGDVCLLRG